jgi:hypothetical protein
MKHITDESRILAYFIRASQAEATVMLDKVKLVMDVRFPKSVSEKPKRGRPPGKKPAEPKLSAAVGDKGAG